MLEAVGDPFEPHTGGRIFERTSEGAEHDWGEVVVTIVHSGWERLGAEGPGRRERNERGWAGVLEHYSRAAVQS